MVVLHEEEKMDAASLDMLKGGNDDNTGCNSNDCNSAVCNINTGK